MLHLLGVYWKAREEGREGEKRWESRTGPSWSVRAAGGGEQRVVCDLCVFPQQQENEMRREGYWVAVQGGDDRTGPLSRLLNGTLVLVGPVHPVCLSPAVSLESSFLP